MHPNDLTEKLRHELAPFSEMLYQEAWKGNVSGSSQGHLSDSCPLYMALDQIEERYGELEPIGTGGMKQVFRVYDALAARYVAMAMPRESLPSDSYDAFLREAHLTARLEHPCITRLFDMGIDPKGRPFFTMELMKGRSLRDVLRSLKSEREVGAFPLLKRLSVFLRVCEAISYAHSRRILHLDIKPENIQVGDFGEVHICDWGLAVIAPDGDHISDSEILLDSDLYCSLNRNVDGTLEYMAPERMDLRQNKSKQMDIYSLGCLLQELITLKSPSKPRDGLVGVAPGLAAVIQRAKAEKPEDRYESVTELREEILRFIGGFSTSAQKLSFWGECLLFYQRNRTSCRLTGGLLALVVVGLSLAVQQINVKRQEADAASARYLAEKLRAESRLHHQASSLFHDSHFLTQPLFMDAERFPLVVDYSLGQFEPVIADEPQPELRVWSQQFWLFFLKQDLNSAEILARRDVDLQRVVDLVTLTKEFAPRLNDSGYLSAEDFIALLNEMGQRTHPDIRRARYPLIERMLLYDTCHSRTTEEREKIVAAILKMVNPGWDVSDLQYDVESSTLHLTGPSLSHLQMMEGNGVSGLSLLRVFNCRVLDLRGTSVTDLNDLNGLELNRINVSQTPVQDLSPLASMRTLQEIVTSPGQFNAEQKSAVPEWVRFVEVADPSEQ